MIMSYSTAATGLTLRPVEADFVPTLQGVIDRVELIRAIASEAVEAGLTEVIFVGCGGSFSSSIHAASLLEARSQKFNVRNTNAAEFSVSPPARLGPKALVIASSHSGGTPETVEAAKFAREAGARVVAVSRDDDNPLAHTGHYSLSYHSERTVTSSKQILLAQLAQALLEASGEPGSYEDARKAYQVLPHALRAVLTAADPELEAIARGLQGDRPIYVVAAGPNFGAAFTLSLCYFMEMQWLNASNIGAGDYLHGPFEMLTENASLVVFQGEDATRPLTERVIRFAKTHGKHVFVLDSKTFELSGVPDSLRGEVSGILLGVLCSRLAEHMEATTGHSLDERRYMYKVEY
jgi:fructoselysine 6-phosphate deglycase